MLTALLSTDWVPPLLRYFDKFGHSRIFEFLIELDNKFSADLIVQLTPTERLCTTPTFPCPRRLPDRVHSSEANRIS